MARKVISIVGMVLVFAFLAGACTPSADKISTAVKQTVGKLPQTTLVNTVAATQTKPVVSTAIPASNTPAASNTKPVTITSTPIAPLNRFDHASVLTWLIRAIENRDAAIFSQLVVGNIGYGNHLEGGQIVSKQKFLSDLAERLPSHPKCESYVIMDQNTIQVWTSGWTPAWKMTELCYVNGCNLINPPYQNHDAGFFLARKDDGWIIEGMELIDAKLGEDLYRIKKYSCDSMSQLDIKTPVKIITPTPSVCSTTFKTRLKVGDYASISTDPPYPLRVRRNPGMAGLVVTQLQPGQGIAVMDGPACAEGLFWWNVRSLNGTIEGWVAEGETNDYWLIPCSSGNACGTR